MAVSSLEQRLQPMGNSFINVPDSQRNDEGDHPAALHCRMFPAGNAARRGRSVATGYVPFRLAREIEARGVLIVSPDDKFAAESSYDLPSSARALRFKVGGSPAGLPLIPISQCTALPYAVAPPLDDMLSSRLHIVVLPKVDGGASQPTLPFTPADSAAALCAPLAEVTTIMIRNLPIAVKQNELLRELDCSGFAGLYDFCYLPSCFHTSDSKGFAFVNFASAGAAEVLFDAWHQSRKFGIMPTQPVLNLSPAAVQGKEANIAKWQAPRMRRIRNPNLRPFIADIEPRKAPHENNTTMLSPHVIQRDSFGCCGGWISA